MTILGAVGYILGVGWGLVSRCYRFFAVLFACAGLLLLIAGSGVKITFLQPTNIMAWTVRLGDGALLGVALIAGSAALWFSRRELKR